MALDVKGKAWTWGIGKCGRLGHGNTKDCSKPKHVVIDDDVVVLNVKAGWSHSLVVSTDGKVYVWGCGKEGRLGLNSYADIYKPCFLKNLSPEKLSNNDMVTSIAAGYAHTIFVTMHGRLFACGHNLHGQLGFDHYPRDAVVKKKKTLVVVVLLID